MFLRRSGLTFKVFAPISDLKQISKIGLQGYEQQALDPMRKNNVTIAGGQVLGDEWAEHVVANRSGIILRARYFIVFLCTGYTANSYLVPFLSPINGSLNLSTLLMVFGGLQALETFPEQIFMHVDNLQKTL